MHCTVQVDGSSRILVTVVASQELEVGDVLRRFKAEVSQDETNRGNDTNWHTLGVWNLLLFMGDLLHAFVFVCLCVLVCGIFSAMFCIFIQDKVTAFVC